MCGCFSCRNDVCSPITRYGALSARCSHGVARVVSRAVHVRHASFERIACAISMCCLLYRALLAIISSRVVRSTVARAVSHVVACWFARTVSYVVSVLGRACSRVVLHAVVLFRVS